MSIQNVHGCTRIQESASNREFVAPRRVVERCPPLVVRESRLSCPSEQEVDESLLALDSRMMQGGPTVRVALVNVGARLQGGHNQGSIPR